MVSTNKSTPSHHPQTIQRTWGTPMTSWKPPYTYRLWQTDTPWHLTAGTGAHHRDAGTLPWAIGDHRGSQGAPRKTPWEKEGKVAKSTGKSCENHETHGKMIEKSQNPRENHGNITVKWWLFYHDWKYHWISWTYSTPKIEVINSNTMVVLVSHLTVWQYDGKPSMIK